MAESSFPMVERPGCEASFSVGFCFLFDSVETRVRAKKKKKHEAGRGEEREKTLSRKPLNFEAGLTAFSVVNILAHLLYCPLIALLGKLLSFFSTEQFPLK